VPDRWRFRMTQNDLHPRVAPREIPWCVAWHAPSADPRRAASHSSCSASSPSRSLSRSSPRRSRSLRLASVVRSQQSLSSGSMAVAESAHQKAQRGLIIKPDISSPDFYITAATIIPVLFLALVLEGGLWKWIQEQISDASDPPTAIRVFVSLLQVFAVFVLIAGALGEMTELYALWQADYSNVLSDIVFSTTALLVILLTAELSLQIPGLWLVTFSTIDLRLSIDEELRWSGVCARSSGRPG